jgi:small conductance mechanosensitive channel
MKGDVHTIELFSTTLVHPDQSRIIIPNRKIVGEILHNFGTMRQIHLSVAVPHGSDLATVLALAREVVAANPRVLTQPAAVVGVAQIEATGVRIGVNPWVRVSDVVAAEGEILPDPGRAVRGGRRWRPLPRQEVQLVNSS